VLRGVGLLLPVEDVGVVLVLCTQEGLCCWWHGGETGETAHTRESSVIFFQSQNENLQVFLLSHSISLLHCNVYVETLRDQRGLSALRFLSDHAALLKTAKALKTRKHFKK